MCETNDNFIGNYRSIYTTKQTTIRAAQEIDVKQLRLVDRCLKRLQDVLMV